jgi:hypothetical protein
VASGFKVDVSEVRRLSDSVTQVATQATDLAGTLAGVWADTGRSDSDTMGRLGPTDVSDLLKTLASELTNDAERLSATAALYEASDSEVVDAMGRLL